MSEFKNYTHYFKSPTRVDLSGGTLDLWPIFAILGEVLTINVGINIYTHCGITPRQDKSIIIHSKDFNKTWEYKNLESCLADADEKTSFYRAHFEFWKPTKGFEIITASESPVGGGLGGSSSLSISLFKAFSHWLNVKKYDPYEQVKICSNIEAKILHTPTGTQDYFPAIRGGLNYLDYGYHGVTWKVVPDTSFLNDKFTLIYTGRTHHSGLNNWQVLQKFIDKDKATISDLKSLAQVSQKIKVALEQKNMQGLEHGFKAELQFRRSLSPAFTSPEIESLAQWSETHNVPLKICGAGGGGCVLALYDFKNDKFGLSDQVKKINGKILDVNPVVLDEA